MYAHGFTSSGGLQSHLGTILCKQEREDGKEKEGISILKTYIDTVSILLFLRPLLRRRCNGLIASYQKHNGEESRAACDGSEQPQARRRKHLMTLPSC